ncbi:ADP-ribosyl-(dinitrogen reductase) hydrolase [Solimicrobium silvestre]|uniref:ADP-ribosyl-(Dinitrogen reductase) hydrolase n=1 Tax=Solimicrobium silvestre TaxID=2099400 RepID=A0A2S9H3W4_9BURK|nr:ADP-ribosyl-(dinitrogen reductase) hydrolase [Solimicrobium silvestre]PRC94669.1 hypothetical protein S2091_0672 [Solimicrobium silvestre]
MTLIIDPPIRVKLREKHQVSEVEVRECIRNTSGKYLMDDREEHKTNPPTYWFLSETDNGRMLKIVFMLKGSDMILKSAFEPRPSDIKTFNKAA